MPVSNGKIRVLLNSSTQQIEGVDFRDVMQVTGCNVPDIGYLIQNGSINPWAKYKPVVLNSKDTSGQWNVTNLRWKYPSELATGVTAWWKGQGNTIAGITPYRIQTAQLTANSIQTVINQYDGGMNGWVYTRPAGGATQPFRDTDFALYNSNAVPPIQNFVVKGTIPYDSQASGGGGKLTADAMFLIANDESYDSITLADLSNSNYNFNGLYFGIVVVNSSNTPVLVATSNFTQSARIERTLGDNGTVLSKGNYIAYPILSSVEIFSMLPFTNATTMYIYTAPMCSPQPFSVVDKDYTVDITLECRPNLTTGTSGSFTIYNDTTAPITSLKYAISTSSASPNANAYTNWSGTTTVNGNSSATMVGVNFGNNTYFHVTFQWGGSASSYVYHRYLIIPKVIPYSN